LGHGEDAASLHEAERATRAVSISVQYINGSKNDEKARRDQKHEIAMLLWFTYMPVSRQWARTSADLWVDLKPCIPVLPTMLCTSLLRGKLLIWRESQGFSVVSGQFLGGHPATETRLDGVLLGARKMIAPVLT
jgi:hypothetical protein